MNSLRAAISREDVAGRQSHVQTPEQLLHGGGLSPFLGGRDAFLNQESY